MMLAESRSLHFAVSCLRQGVLVSERPKNLRSPF
jgi:hypothetical protein